MAGGSKRTRAGARKQTSAPRSRAPNARAAKSKPASAKTPKRPPAPRPEPNPVEPDLSQELEGFRSGYVVLIGRPNVGKSTLLNQLLGQKIAATTHKPQTTRKNLLGVLHPKGAQILLLDTPGHHRAKGPLNKFMVEQVRAAVGGADVLGWVLEAREDTRLTPGNERVLEEVRSSGRPVVVLVNKVDQVKDKTKLLPFMQRFQDLLGEQLASIVPISALRRDGLDRVVRAFAEALPEGPPLYEEDRITDVPERSIVAEMVREKVMLETKEELPYAAAVGIDAFEDLRPKLVRIAATIHVERDSQKAIVIGAGGERLKAIGQRARKDIEYFLDSKVYLDLHVRVTERWSERPRALAELGYTMEREGE